MIQQAKELQASKSQINEFLTKHTTGDWLVMESGNRVNYFQVADSHLWMEATNPEFCVPEIAVGHQFRYSNATLYPTKNRVCVDKVIDVIHGGESYNREYIIERGLRHIFLSLTSKELEKYYFYT